MRTKCHDGCKEVSTVLGTKEELKYPSNWYIVTDINSVIIVIIHIEWG